MNRARLFFPERLQSTSIVATRFRAHTRSGVTLFCLTFDFLKEKTAMTSRAACVFAALMSLVPLTFSQSQTAAESSSSPVAPDFLLGVTTAGGTVNTIPLFTTATNIQNSILTQSGAAVNVAGKLRVEGDLGIGEDRSYEIGGQPFALGSFTNQNAFLGFAGNTTNSGIQNTADGVGALQSDTTGYANTAYGLNALNANTTGAA